MPQIKTGVPQKGRASGGERFKRAKSKEAHYIQNHLERMKLLGGIETCAICGSELKAYEFAKGDQPKWTHMYIETAAKAGPHYPELRIKDEIS